jgi:hypothetical protein
MSLRKFIKRRLRNSQRGQSIILLAMAFIMLAAFVGLVTDISILFIRYATLRRAVDAAALAAAGQVREGTDYGTVSMAARQYIVMHGLVPERVYVETCETDVHAYRQENGFGGTDYPETELCNWDDPRKLVRVRAQIRSETTFLKLLGIDDFMLTASSVAETAILDVALVLDNSYSMSRLTSYYDYRTLLYEQYEYSGGTLQAVPSSIAWPPRTGCFTGSMSTDYNDYNPADYDGPDAASLTNEQKQQRLMSDAHAIFFRNGRCCNDPGNGKLEFVDGEWRVTGFTHNNEVDRFGNAVTSTNADEDGYTDLICQPFKGVRDAARNFIQQLDFIRGDRVGLVTFARAADVIEPQYTADGNARINPMMESETIAVDTLNELVGIDLHPNPNGIFDACPFNGLYTTDDATDSFSWGISWEDMLVNLDTLDANYSETAPPAEGYILEAGVLPWPSYEAVAACTGTNVGDGIRYANAMLTNVDSIRRDAVWVAIILSDGDANAGYVRPEVEAVAGPNRYADNFPQSGATLPDGSPDPVGEYPDLGFCPWSTFCYSHPLGHPNPLLGWKADIQNTNIEVPFLFWGDDNERSDDPYATSNIGDVQTPAEDPYNGNGFDDEAWIAGRYRASILQEQGQYVFMDPTYPWNLPAYPECVDAMNHADANRDPSDPFTYPIEPAEPWCNDGNPTSRHFCLAWSQETDTFGNPGPGNAECQYFGRYDADDYARDMADWAGLVEIRPGVPGNFIAMFSIAFDSGELLESDTAVPLLRYISDAGDNGFIDNNHQQAMRNAEYGISENLGGQDPCFGVSDLTEECGQYYYADNLQDLQQVFEDIASRLFTRLSR